METGVIIGLLGVLLSGATFVVGRATSAKKEGKESGRETGQILTDINYIKENLSKIEGKLDQGVGRLETRVDNLTDKVTESGVCAAKAYESCRILHKRLNEHFRRDHNKPIVEYLDDDLVDI